MSEKSSDITRRLVMRGTAGDIITETVHAWHYRSQGAGEPGGRTYSMLYCPDGRVRIDVSGVWSSFPHTLWVKADEIRPRDEWMTWVAETNQSAVEPRWCMVDGLEIDPDSNPEFDEDCCSTACRIEMRPDF